MKMKLAENGISFETFQNIYAKFGNNGLFAIVALPKSSNKSQPRITHYRRIQHKSCDSFKIKATIDTIWVKLMFDSCTSFQIHLQVRSKTNHLNSQIFSQTLSNENRELRLRWLARARKHLMNACMVSENTFCV